MGKPIRWKWFGQSLIHHSERRHAVLTSFDELLACNNEGIMEHLSTHSADAKLIESAPVLLDAVEELIEAFGHNFIAALDDHLTDSQAVVVREAIDAIETIQALREEESNDA